MYTFVTKFLLFFLQVKYGSYIYVVFKKDYLLEVVIFMVSVNRIA